MPRSEVHAPTDEALQTVLHKIITDATVASTANSSMSFATLERSLAHRVHFAQPHFADPQNGNLQRQPKYDGPLASWNVPWGQSPTVDCMVSVLAWPPA